MRQTQTIDMTLTPLFFSFLLTLSQTKYIILSIISSLFSQISSPIPQRTPLSCSHCLACKKTTKNNNPALAKSHRLLNSPDVIPNTIITYIFHKIKTARTQKYDNISNRVTAPLRFFAKLGGRGVRESQSKLNFATLSHPCYSPYLIYLPYCRSLSHPRIPGSQTVFPSHIILFNGRTFSTVCMDNGLQDCA